MVAQMGELRLPHTPEGKLTQPTVEHGAGQLSQCSRPCRPGPGKFGITFRGPEIQWIHGYIVDDKIYCVYEAPDADIIRRHAEMGGFPANRISPVTSVIDPSTAE